VANPDLQRQNEIKELRAIIQSGYRLSDDPRPNTLVIYQAIERDKLYLIPLLKELGMRPIDKGLVPEFMWNVDPLFGLLRILIVDKKTEAFKVVLDCYNLSDDQFDEFIKCAGVIDPKYESWNYDSSSFLPNFLEHIIPVVPSNLVNNYYSLGLKSNLGQPQTLLCYSVRHCIEQHLRRDDVQDILSANVHIQQIMKMMEEDEDATCDLSLINQLLAKGADPLLADSEGYGILKMISYNKADSYRSSKPKKKIKWLLSLLVTGFADCRKQLIVATLNSFPPELSELCADYDFELHDDRLLQAIGDGKKEDEVLEDITTAFNKVPEHYHESLVNRCDDKGQTSLMYAASENYVNVMRVLYSKGGNLWITDDFDRHVLHHASASSNADPAKVYATISFILEQAKEQEKDVNSLLNTDPGGSYVPLLNAVVLRRPKVVQLLVQNRANPLIACDASGRNALDIASEFEDKTIYEALQKYGAEQPASKPKFSDYPYAVPEASESEE
jgi:hypothetical protein